MSTKCPSIAAAAAIIGLTRWVRLPLPWRPSKLRFEVLAERSPLGSNVVVHADAHAAAGIAPLEAGVDENFVQAFFFGLHFDHSRARNDQRFLHMF